jgi:hypothetical protein
MLERYGMWTIIEEIRRGHPLHNGKRATLLCRCDCGTEKILDKYTVVNNRTNSCGCAKRDISKRSDKKDKVDTFKKDYDKFYNTWANVKNRCNNTRYKQYDDYGGRGITYDIKWETFEGFKEDMYDSYIEHVNLHGERNTSIDRIDVNGNYCKENCKWATKKEQARNRTDNIAVIVDGITYKTLIELAETYNIEYNLVSRRYKQGLTNLDLVKPRDKEKKKSRTKGIQIEINGIIYESLTQLHKAYPYISISTLSERHTKGLRGEELIALPRGMRESDLDKYNK